MKRGFFVSAFSVRPMGEAVGEACERLPVSVAGLLTPMVSLTRLAAGSGVTTPQLDTKIMPKTAPLTTVSVENILQLRSKFYKKRPKRVLKLRASKGHPAYNLPLVGRLSRHCFVHPFAPPSTGGYHGGYDTGEALALLYMKQMADLGVVGTTGYSFLSTLVHSVAHRYAELGGMEQNAYPAGGQSEAFKSFTGQVNGLFNMLGSVLEVAMVTEAKWLQFGAGKRLCDFTTEELLHKANAGLSFDENGFHQALFGME